MATKRKLAAKKAKRKVGRPRLDFDLDQVHELGKIQCTVSELAAVLGCSKRVADDRLATDERFRTAFQSGKECGKESLRRKQFQVAMSGNVSMLIWLGKQHLDQKDRQDVTSADGPMAASIYLPAKDGDGD